MGWRPMLYLLALAGCFAAPPRPGGPGESCGDSVIDKAETCDDGNTTAADGCSAECTIEPWFECARPGQLCHPILALQWTGNGSTLPALGNGGGVDFNEECGTLAGITGPNTVLVGLQGEIEASSETSLFALQGQCADIELLPDGSIRWELPQLTAPLGGSGAGGTGLQIRTCDPDEVVVGFAGNANDVEASSIELFCQAITHDNGKLRFGSPRKLEKLGAGVHNEQPEARCTDGHVARAVVGRSGAIIDSFTLRCVPTERVECGDSVPTSPFETCDDGNATPGDGCNATCSGD